MTLWRKILNTFSFGRRGGGCHGEGLYIKGDEKRMITFLTGLTIGFVVGFMTAFIWEHR